MKVLILTEGGPSIGFGHITRCVSIYQAFERVGVHPKILVNGPSSVIPLLSGAKHKTGNWQKWPIKNKDVVIIDSYLSDKKFYERLSKKSKLLVCIDDYNRIEYPDGSLVVNCVVGMEGKFGEKNPNNTYLLGSAFAPIRNPTMEADPIKASYTMSDILITVGGMDFSPFLVELLQKLAKELPYLNYHVVVPQQTHFEKKSILHVYPRQDTKDFIKLIQKCDVCISGGGQTTYELANLGMPTISVCLADNQIGNLEGWRETGFIEYAGKKEDPDICEKIIAAVKKMSPHRVRYKKSQLGQKIIDGKGAGSICQTIINSL